MLMSGDVICSFQSFLNLVENESLYCTSYQSKKGHVNKEQQTPPKPIEFEATESGRMVG